MEWRKSEAVENRWFATLPAQHGSGYMVHLTKKDPEICGANNLWEVCLDWPDFISQEIEADSVEAAIRRVIFAIQDGARQAMQLADGVLIAANDEYRVFRKDTLKSEKPAFAEAS